MHGVHGGSVGGEARVEKRGVDRQVVVVVGVHGGFVGGEARCRPPSGGLGGRAWWICGWRCVNCYHDRRSAQTWCRDGYLISCTATATQQAQGKTPRARQAMLNRARLPPQERLPPQAMMVNRAALTSSSQTGNLRTRTRSTGGEDGERSPCRSRDAGL